MDDNICKCCDEVIMYYDDDDKSLCLSCSKKNEDEFEYKEQFYWSQVI
jgi:hypothetical protein